MALSRLELRLGLAERHQLLPLPVEVRGLRHSGSVSLL
jgi:hypothetical protein